MEGVRAWVQLRQSETGSLRCAGSGASAFTGFPPSRPCRPSSIKNILYGKSQNPKLLTIKMICDGLGITLGEFFSTPEFDNLEQEIR